VDPAADGAGGQADAGLGAFAAGLGGSARDLGFGESFEQRVGHVPSADLLAASGAYAHVLAGVAPYARAAGRARAEQGLRLGRFQRAPDPFGDRVDVFGP
jgi:hypothetical protein